MKHFVRKVFLPLLAKTVAGLSILGALALFWYLFDYDSPGSVWGLYTPVILLFVTFRKRRGNGRRSIAFLLATLTICVMWWQPWSARARFYHACHAIRLGTPIARVEHYLDGFIEPGVEVPLFNPSHHPRTPLRPFPNGFTGEIAFRWTTDFAHDDDVAVVHFVNGYVTDVKYQFD